MKIKCKYLNYTNVTHVIIEREKRINSLAERGSQYINGKNKQNQVEK
jgi:hypothetical protein